MLAAVFAVLILYFTVADPDIDEPLGSVAVLPFTNLTGDAGKAYIGDGPPF